METINKLANKKIAVIGAGISSLSFIFSIKPSDKVSIDLFERSKVLSGRCSTRSTDGVTYDNGANYISTSNNKVINTILNELKSEELIQIKEWIFPFDKNNKIDFDEKEAQNHNKLNKYSYKSGISKLGKLLYDNFKLNDFKMFYSTNIEKLSKSESGWELITKDKQFGYYDYIVFGTPAYNFSKVLKESTFSSKEDEDIYKKLLVSKLDEVKYKKIYSLALCLEPENFSSADLNFYALINSDREHPISWISLENKKEGRITGNNSICFIVQMSHEFSEANENEQNQIVIEKIKELVFNLLPKVKNSKEVFANLKLWRLALPINSIDTSILKLSNENGLYIIGDSLLGKGRVDGAMQTGFELYETLASSRNIE